MSENYQAIINKHTKHNRCHFVFEDEWLFSFLSDIKSVILGVFHAFWNAVCESSLVGICT